MKKPIALLAFASLSICVAAALAAGKPATVRLTDESLTAEFVLDKAGRLVVTTKGTPLAAGTYAIKALSVFKKDDKGRMWELRYIVEGRPDTAASLIVDEGQDKVVDPGPPVSIQGWARLMDPPKQDTLRIGFSALGRYGELHVHPMAFLDGKPAPAPTFKLTTQDGKVVHQGTFTVGKQGQLTADWKPGAFKEKVIITVDASFGPFEWKQVDPEKLREIR